MKTLNDVMLETGADKASAHPVKGHDFARHYDRFFSPLRFDRLNLMEIGVGGGESIRGWLEYFPSASIYGVDIVSNTNSWNRPGTDIDKRYRFLQGDETDKTMWECLKAVWGKEFQIVINDAGHFNDGIITSFGSTWEAITPGGYWCCEDLGSGYTPGSVHVKPGFPPHAQWLHAFVDRLMQGAADIDSAYFAEELLILRKRG